MGPGFSILQSSSASMAPKANVPVPSDFNMMCPGATRSMKSLSQSDISVIRHIPLYAFLIVIFLMVPNALAAELLAEDPTAPVPLSGIHTPQA